MKVIALNGSPNKKGNTYEALQLVAGELEKENIGVETVTVGDKVFQGCTGCRGCRAAGRCVLPDPAFGEIMDKVLEADGLILGSPVYYGGINGTMKCFLDRAFFSDTRGLLHHKVGTALVVLRRSGAMSAYEQLNNYLMASEILMPPCGWNIIYGAQPGEIREDKEGIQRLRRTGKNMAWLLKMKEQTKNTLTPPAPEARVFFNFIRTDANFKP
ncbi:Multimeric flavodoxin WrbA [Sporobacter termitidis DSM 10068]|uniref:Multimeric flavodoxin WrbA n=1 Tax=Sporobacter termitidis DSM 10068 TaxID=1123282 RepID=A0A1M5Y811_9FIRM|nr:flavodoxin family protein [Sporobacter termitidis]SHI07948.1 Multimeric flavodoxin WrbA [Sporobacter termitidis DSM 10068]